jgi:hypothetical protein
MPDRTTTNRLVTAAARRHLQPLGLHQRGRSRLWFADCGWWVIIVEFSPSRSEGCYLNIAAMWLWNPRDYWAFDDGGRLYWRSDGSFTTQPPIGEPGWTSFLSFINADQFDRDIDLLASIAAQRVAQLRSQFPTPAIVARQLAGRATRQAECRRDGPAADMDWRSR